MYGLWATRRGTRLVRKGFAFAVFALASASASAVPAIDEGVPDRGIFSLRPAPRWEEGLLIGNGRMGGVVLGRPGDEVIHLSHERVVIPNHLAEPPPNLSHLLPETRRLIREGKRQEAAQMVWEESRRIAGWNGLVWTDPFVNACNLEIKLPGLAKPDAYRRSIDYETGVARVQWVGGETRYEERAFLSRPDNIMVLEITAAGKKKLEGIVALKAGAHPYRHRIRDEQLLSAEGWLTYRCGYTLTDGGYEVIGRVESDGTYANEGDSIRFSGARRVRVLLRIVPLDGSADSQFDKTKAALKSLGRKSFAELLASHVAVHGELFRRVKLDLSSDVAERTMPAEDLWKKTHKADATPALLERVFDAGRYQIICSTGDWPPNLQGVWHGGGESAWMGDFTLNGNVPSAIAHYLNGNLPELLLSFTSYLEERIPQFRANAKNLYNCRGILVPGRSHIHGYDLHYNDDYPHQAWMAGAAWAGSFFYDYYRYTGDRDYLRDHAVPWMKETVLFFEDYLVEDKSGYFEVVPSYSPEHGGTARNTTMDVAAIRMTLRNLISACRELGIEKENIVRWQAMLAKLPPYRINAQGQLAEWIDDKMPDNLEHRHASHFLPMWHGLQPEIARDPRILAAARKAVADKAAVRCRDKKGGVMGFGTVQIGLAAASLRDAETVWRVIDNLSTLYWFPTFAAAHNCGRNGPEIFNADICGGLPAVMIDMLVQSKPGEITLLPALPDNLPRGTLEGALLRGAITVERLEWSPDSVTVELRSPKTQEVILRTGPRAVSLTLNENRSVRRTFVRNQTP